MPWTGIPLVPSLLLMAGAFAGVVVCNGLAYLGNRARARLTPRRGPYGVVHHKIIDGEIEVAA
jgi:hypothetical protein